MVIVLSLNPLYYVRGWLTLTKQQSGTLSLRRMKKINQFIFQRFRYVRFIQKVIMGK